MSEKAKYSGLESTHVELSHIYNNDVSSRHPEHKEAPSFYQRLKSFLRSRLGSKKDLNGALFKATFGEFLATFLFFFCAQATALNNLRQSSPENVALAATSITFGATGIIMAFWELSGACLNPCVTFSQFIHGHKSFATCKIILPLSWMTHHSYLLT